MHYDTIPRKGIKLPGTLTTETSRMKILKLLLIIQFKGGRTLYIELLYLLNSSLYKTVAHGTVLAQIFLVLLFIRPASSTEEEIFYAQVAIGFLSRKML